jgi:anhydro-N-acetylmuramic acid kinase
VSELYLGLMSGTSLDGVDAAIVRFEPEIKIEAARTVPWREDLRTRLDDFSHARYVGDPIDELGRLDRAVAEFFAAAALTLLEDAGVQTRQIAAIGSHGQTVRHRPPTFTLQLGDPNLLAAVVGIPVVADFRRKDLALGGQGAPLVPAFHRAVFSRSEESRAVLNIGGIANITRLTPGSDVTGWDVGPGNVLMNAWIERHSGRLYDADGAWAASAALDGELLAALWAEPWFAAAPPKSSGRELFNLEWLARRAPRAAGLPAAVVQSTLCELTARAAAEALRDQPVARLILCGGGVHNGELCRRLAARLPESRVETSAVHGLDPDFVEAAAFAWLAREAMAGRTGNLTAVTGARRAAVLGGIYRP